MKAILESICLEMIDRSELMIFKGEFSWNLNVDLLVLDEMSMEQIDYLGLCMRTAFDDLELPQTIATLNNNTGKIEVGLVEEVYADKENTDQAIKLKSASQGQMPFIISLGIIQPPDADGPIIIIDAESQELLCVSQILHLGVDKNLRIHGMIQSKGEYASDKLVAGIPANLFLKTNLKSILEKRVKEMQGYFEQ